MKMSLVFTGVVLVVFSTTGLTYFVNWRKHKMVLSKDLWGDKSIDNIVCYKQVELMYISWWYLYVILYSSCLSFQVLYKCIIPGIFGIGSREVTSRLARISPPLINSLFFSASMYSMVPQQWYYNILPRLLTLVATTSLYQPFSLWQLESVHLYDNETEPL